MIDKKILISVAVCAGILCTLPFVINKSADKPSADNQISTPKIKKSENKKITSEKNTNAVKKNVQNAETNSEEKVVKKSDLYSDLSPNTMPFCAISELAELPAEIQSSVKKIAENSNGIFMAKKVGNKLLLVVDNPEDIRHGVEFVEISLANGHQTRTTLGYNGKMKDSDNDSWEYETIDETKVPIRHTKFNKNGDIEFIETWSHDGSNPVKYEMKDDKGKTISMKKETAPNENDLRIEHLIYDKDGNTKVNVSASYEGADIKRFTYYNADKQAESGSVFSEYSEGLKTKETFYNSNLQLQTTYTSEYKNGERTQMNVFDADNNEVEKIVPKD